MTPEGKLKAACRKIAKAQGLMFHNVEGKGVNGILDTICGHVDQLGVVWVEFKVTTGPTEQQLARAAEIKNAGDRVAFCYSVEDYRHAVGLL